jgi:hypothetical protein
MYALAYLVVRLLWRLTPASRTAAAGPVDPYPGPYSVRLAEDTFA